MRNNKLTKRNRQFMWGNMILGLGVIILVFVVLYFCNWR